VRDAQPRGHGSRRIERNVEACHHATEDVDRERDPGPPDRQALLLVDNDDVELRMIDLDEVERSLNAAEAAGARSESIEGNFAMRTPR